MLFAGWSNNRFGTSFPHSCKQEANMSTKITIALAAAIVLSSAVGAAAQVPEYYGYGYGPIGRGSLRSLAAPPSPLDYPSAAGGGSIGYNENLKRDDW
jgi:hypothetical protein